MKLKVDENLPIEVTQLLRQEGFDAHSVMDEELSGAADSTIADVCRTERRALITLDLDFASISDFPPESYHGLIVLRLKRTEKVELPPVIEALVPLLRESSIERQLWVVDENRVRIRR